MGPAFPYGTVKKLVWSKAELASNGERERNRAVAFAIPFGRKTLGPSGVMAPAEQHGLPLTEIVEIVAFEHLIANLPGAFAQTPFQRRPPLRRIERLRLDLSREKHFGQRLARRQHRLDGRAAA